MTGKAFLSALHPRHPLSESSLTSAPPRAPLQNITNTPLPVISPTHAPPHSLPHTPLDHMPPFPTFTRPIPLSARPTYRLTSLLPFFLQLLLLLGPLPFCLTLPQAQVNPSASSCILPTHTPSPTTFQPNTRKTPPSCTQHHQFGPALEIHLCIYQQTQTLSSLHFTIDQQE